MWINSSAFLALEKILSWPLTEFLSQQLCKFCKKFHLFPRSPHRFDLCILAKNTSPSRLWKSCISKTICFLFQGVAQSCMTVKLVKYFVASINKLTFWKFPTVSGHLRHCLVFVTLCPLPIISRWCVIDTVDLTRLLKCHKCCGLWHHLMFFHTICHKCLACEWLHDTRWCSTNRQRC